MCVAYDRIVPWLLEKGQNRKWHLCMLGLQMIKCQKYMQKTLTFSDSLFKLDLLFSSSWFETFVWHFQYKAVFSCLSRPPLHAGPSSGGKYYQDMRITRRYSHIFPSSAAGKSMWRTRFASDHRGGCSVEDYEISGEELG